VADDGGDLALALDVLYLEHRLCGVGSMGA
jgi:hypothetical protein